MFVESHVRITFSYCNLHDMTNSMTEIPKVGEQLPEWLVPLHLYMTAYMYRCREKAAHRTISPNIWCASGL